MRNRGRGKSGASDADMMGTSNMMNGMLGEDAGALPPDLESDALGEPVGVVEVIELETMEPATSAPEQYPDGMGMTWLRWWYVPALAGMAAGGTAAFILLRRRNRKPAPVSAYKAATKQSRDWMEAVRSGKATQSAVKALQQGAASVRESARGLPDTAATLRDRSGELVGVVAASAAAQQAAQGVRGALDSATSFWNSNAPGAKRAAKARRRGLFGWLAGGKAPRTTASARDAAKAQAAKAANRTMDKVKPAIMTAVAIQAAKKAARAKAQTNRAAKRAGKRANQAVSRTRAFAFGALVTATLTYARAWRKRMMEREMRETAGGRMVRDA